MSKHTSGPWLVDTDNCVINIAGESVCELNYQHETEAEVKQCEADACLIAAAPEMLEILEAILINCGDLIANDPNNTGMIIAIRSVIAKATGGDR